MLCLSGLDGRGVSLIGVHHGNIAETGRRCSAEACAAHGPARLQTGGGPLNGATAVATVELINGLHQAIPFVVLRICHRHHQVRLQDVCSLQVLHQNTCLGKVPVGPENVLNKWDRGFQQHAGVIAGQIESDAGCLAVER